MTTVIKLKRRESRSLPVSFEIRAEGPKNLKERSEIADSVIRPINHILKEFKRKKQYKSLDVTVNRRNRYNKRSALSKKRKDTNIKKIKGYILKTAGDNDYTRKPKKVSIVFPKLKGKKVSTSLVEDLKSKLKKWRVIKKENYLPKVRTYVENKLYNESKMENKLRLISLNKKEEARKAEKAYKRKMRLEEEKKMVNFFYSKKREFRDISYQIKQKKESKERLVKDCYISFCLIVLTHKFLKKLDNKVNHIKTTKLKKNRQKLAFKKISIQVKRKVGTIVQNKQVNITNMLITAFNIKQAAQQNISKHIHVIRLILLNKLRNDRIKWKLVRINFLFISIRDRMARASCYRREFEKETAHRLTHFTTNLSSKLKDSKYVMKANVVLIQVLYIIHQNSLCFDFFNNFKGQFLFKTNIFTDFDNMHNEILRLILLHFPIKTHYKLFLQLKDIIEVLRNEFLFDKIEAVMVKYFVQVMN